MTSAEIQFCKRTCDTASALGIGARRYEAANGLAFGYEWQLPSGEIVQGQAYLGMNEKRALHAACKTLSEKLLEL